MKAPLISIVIANYNYGHFIEDAIRSVIMQDGFDECELIVVDGGSSDNSVEVIKKYADKIAWWVSEKDKGQSDAFNKGFAKARGRFGCWLNADDLLLPGTLDAVLKTVEVNPQVEWITGGSVFFKADLKVWRACSGTCVTRSMLKWVDSTVVGGPSSFFSIARLRSVGGFDTNLHYTMDCALWNLFLGIGMMITHVNRYFWGFRIHSMSKTSHSIGGCRNPDFEAEAMRVDAMRPPYHGIFRSRVLALRVRKLINGCFFKSCFDTLRWRGKSIAKIGVEI